MKKNCQYIAFFLFLFVNISYAQDQTATEQKVKKSNFWFGPKVGLDLFTPTIDQNTIKAQVESNYQLGFFMQFGRKFYFQPEFYYATQNEKTETTTTTKTTINTLKMPMMLGMRLINLKIVSAHIMAGPSLSYLLKESAPNSSNPRPQSSFALQGGGGADLLGFITLDVRYSVDLGGSVNAQVKQLKWDSGVNVTLGLKMR